MEKSGENQSKAVVAALFHRVFRDSDLFQLSGLLSFGVAHMLIGQDDAPANRATCQLQVEEREKKKGTAQLPHKDSSSKLLYTNH